MDWLQGLMGSDTSTLWGAIKVYFGASIFKDLVDMGLDLIVLVTTALVMLFVVAKNKVMEKLRSFLGKLFEDEKGKRIKALLDRYQNDPEIIELVRVIHSAKQDPSKQGIANRKAAIKELSDHISKDLVGLKEITQDNPRAGIQMHRQAFDSVKQGLKPTPEVFSK
jgi:hypothetical protein